MKRKPSITFPLSSFPFLAAGLLLAGGCQPPAPLGLRPGRVNLGRLLAVHPQHAALDQLDDEISRLKAAQAAMAVIGRVALPPSSFQTPPTPGIPSMEGQLIEALSQAREVLRRQQAVLERELAEGNQEKLAIRRQELEAQAASAQAQQETRIRQQVEERRRQVALKYRQQLFNLDINRRLAPTEQQRAKLAAQLAGVRRQQADELEAASKQGAQELARTQGENRERIDRQLADYRQQLESESAQMIEQRRKHQEQELERRLRALSSTAGPPQPKEMRLETPELARRLAANAAQAAAEARRQQKKLGPVIAQTQQSRDRLKAAMERDFRLLVDSLGRDRGYRISFGLGPAPDLTGQVRRWLEEYWKGTSRGARALGHWHTPTLVNSQTRGKHT